MTVVLFDIDGTLVLTGGAGARAMTRAFAAVFAVDGGMTGVSMAGRTDTWIISEMARVHGLDYDDALFRRCHQTYLDYLAFEIQQRGSGRKTILPGVREALDALVQRDDVYLALLTGNFTDGARIKLEHFDLWRYFPCGAFAEDAPDRNALLPKVILRVAECGGPAVTPESTVVIGDTPLDVGVALAGGARSIAVATGSYDVQALRETGADVVLEDLSDLPAVFAALGLRLR